MLTLYAGDILYCVGNLEPKIYNLEPRTVQEPRPTKSELIPTVFTRRISLE
jgi:hypothetical protein